MSLLCTLVRHKPSLASLARDGAHGYRAYCERCRCPIEQQSGQRWRARPPLYERNV